MRQETVATKTEVIMKKSVKSYFTVSTFEVVLTGMFPSGCSVILSSRSLQNDFLFLQKNKKENPSGRIRTRMFLLYTFSSIFTLLSGEFLVVL